MEEWKKNRVPGTYVQNFLPVFLNFRQFGRMTEKLGTYVQNFLPLFCNNLIRNAAAYPVLSTWGTRRWGRPVSGCAWACASPPRTAWAPTPARSSPGSRTGRSSPPRTCTPNQIQIKSNLYHNLDQSRSWVRTQIFFGWRIAANRHALAR